MNPPVDAPTSRQSSPAGSTPNASSACASFSPPRETYRGPALDVELGGLVHLLARLRVAGHAAGEDQRLRLRAALREPPLDEQDVQPLLHRASRRFGRRGRRRSSASTDVSASISASGACARSPAPVRASSRAASTPSVRTKPSPSRMSSTIWKSSPSSSPNAAPRRLLLPGQLGRPERQRHRRVEEAAGLQPVDGREVGARLHRVEVLAADHPERRLGELARDVRRRVRAGEPERLGEERVAGEHRLPLAVRRPDARLARAARRRRRARAGRRGRARSCAPSRARAPRASPARARRPSASPTASEITGRTRLPPISTSA